MTQLSPKPPPPRQARRLSISFRKLNQALGTITHVDIFTGSHTGTSERFAASLADKAVKCGAIVTLQSLEDFNPECYNDPNGPYHATSRATVFVVSTHFAGGSSPDAEAFSQWLRLASGDSNGVSTADLIQLEETRQTNTTSCTPAADTIGTRTTIDLSPESKQRKSTQILSPTTVGRPRRQSSFSAAVRPLLRMNWRTPFESGNGSASTSKPKNPLHGVQYAVFGVGNSMYLTYNAMGKFVDARMQALGGVRLCPLGLGDVSNDIDDVYAKWEANFLQLLAYQKPGPPAGIGIDAQESSVVEGQCIPIASSNDETALTKPTTNSPSISTRPCSQELIALHDPSSDGSASTTIPVAHIGTGSPVKLSMQDLYGRHVRLRFRCRYVDKHDVKPPTDFKLPVIAIYNEIKTPRKLSRRHTAVRRDATHIRNPCIALQALSVLIKSDVVSEDCQLSASALTEISLARLAILDPHLTFETADTFGYYPPNSKEIVDAIGSKLGLDMNAYVKLSFHDGEPNPTATEAVDPAVQSAHNKDRHLPFPTPCRIHTILSDFLELQSISREFLRVASGFVVDQKEHELLENMASIDGSAAFNREFAQSNSGMMKLLELAPSLRIPFEVFVNITPLLKPRLYSIASSHFKNDREFDIVVALGNPKPMHGLSVSNFRRILSKSELQLHPTDSRTSDTAVQAVPSSAPVLRMLRGFVAASCFKPPADLTAPMIMIANGIGIAPLRALLQHREFEFENGRSNLACPQKLPRTGESVETPTSLAYGTNLLLLGCSTKSSILFESELRDWETKEFLDFHVVHSSEPGQPAQHVQDLVSAHKQKISLLMSSSPDARIYICGKVAMARAVHQILATQDTANGSNSWFQKALQSGRYIEGIFG